ncbi:MAG: LLM class flavin-dependent oxidoreductase [Gammaproteobacteria bacterium]
MLWPAPGLDAGYARARWAETAGYDDAWFPDAEGMHDPIALCAALSAVTSRIRLCTGVVPVFNRPAPILADEVSLITSLAPGRFVLGLGSSTSNMIDRWYGVPFVKPLTHVREYVSLLRGILAGEKTDFRGERVRSHGFRLQDPPRPALPIVLGAMGAKMLQLAGELADGVVLNDFTPLDRLDYALTQLDVGAQRAGRRVEDLEIVKRRAVRATFSDEEHDEAREFFRHHFAFYASAPVYQQMMIALGYRDAAEEVRAGYASRDRARVTRAITDEMVSRIFLFGPPAFCLAQLREHYARGIDTVVVSPQASSAQDFARSAEAFATRAMIPENRTRLS